MAEEMSSLFQKFLKGYRNNQVIFNEGDYGDEMFIIYRGKVRIVKQTSNQEEKTLAELKPGEFFGEMALIDSDPRSATAVSGADGTELIVLDKPKFTYMVSQMPDFSLSIMRKLSRNLRETSRQRVE